MDLESQGTPTPPMRPLRTLESADTPLAGASDDAGPLHVHSQPPPSFDRYAGVRELGRGGMGTVYLAHDPKLDRRVAIKVFHEDLRGMSLDTRGLIEREALALARLADPHVVHVHDVGVAEDRAYIVMEYVEGASLADWLAAAERPLAEILRVFNEAGLGLAAVHAAGLVHGDFKPHNVLVAADGDHAVVLDFGIAEFIADRSRHTPREHPRTLDELTMSGCILGTPRYMSPEHWRRTADESRAIPPQADQFSFCVALWSAIYGEYPFEGESIPELVHHVCAGRVVRPVRLERAPLGLARVLLRGLDRDADARYPSMHALVADLTPERLRANDVVDPADLEARLHRPAVSARPPERLSASATPDSGTAPVEPSRSRLVWIAVAILLVTAAALVAMGA